jgi:putative oxidoreductase
MTDTTRTALAALILRLALGALFLAHAGLKFFVFTPEGAAGYFASLGLPGALAYAVTAIEAIAGAALLLGIAVRTVSLVTLPILFGSIVLVHGPNGWLFSNENGGWEFPAFWAAALVVQALLGAGAYAVRSPLNRTSAASVAA